MLQGGHQPHHVRRAARAPEPAGAARRLVAAGVGVSVAHLERIDVQPAFAVQGDPGEEAVEQGALDQVGVAGAARQQRQAPTPLDRGDGGAGLAVRPLVGQLVRVAEVLLVVMGPEPSGEVGLGGGHRRPQPLRGGPQFLVPDLRRQIGGRGQQVQLPYGVPLDVGRLAQRHPVLAVRLTAQQAVSEPVDEVAGQFQVAPLAGLPVQLHEGGLDLGVAVDAVDGLAAVRRSEDRVDVVGELACHVQEFGAAGGPVVGHRGLDQMSGAVQLVTPAQLLVPLAALAELEPRVEVAVVLLGRGHKGDDAVDVGGERLVLALTELPGGGLQPLVDVRVHERVGTLELALGRARGEPQVVQVARRLQQVGALGDGGAGVDLAAHGPEAVPQLHGDGRECGVGPRARTGTDRTRGVVSRTGEGRGRGHGGMWAGHGSPVGWRETGVGGGTGLGCVPGAGRCSAAPTRLRNRFSSRNVGTRPT
ncbi:hypothetical protein SGRIM119S_03971 [Streptomyces griseorubiginosus]